MSEHFRLTARQSLEHPWLKDEDLYIDVLQELETSWMRACLARRRWHRALNTLKAMHTIKKLTFPDVVPGWSISIILPDLILSLTDAEVIQRIKSAGTTRVTIVPGDLAVPRPVEEYKEKYQNIGVVGSGTFGSVYVAR